MKQYIAVFFFISIVLLTVNYNNALSEAFDEPRVIDQLNIDELTEKIRGYLKSNDFESIIQKLPDNLIFDLYIKTKNSKWVDVKTYSLIRLGRKNEACELMEKTVLYQMDNLYERFFIKGCIDCLNDNYGNAATAYSKAIELCEKPIGSIEIKKFTFVCYGMRASVYALRRMYKEAKADLLKMQEIRQQFPQDFPPDTPYEYLLRKYLEAPENKAFHRVEMPSAKVDPGKISFTVNWWCCGLSEKDKNEYYQLFVKEYLQKNE